MEENRFDLELVAETVTHLRVTVKKGDEYAHGVIYGGVREVGSMAVGSMEAVELDENGSGRLVMPEVSCRGGYYDVYYYDAERGYECKLVWGKIVATPRLAPAMSEQLVEFEAGVPVQDGGEVVVQMAVGERGEKGEKGDKGDKGEPGEPGVPGDVWGEIRLKDADIVPMYELRVSSAGIDFYYKSGSSMRYAGRLGLEVSDYNGGRALKLHNNMPLVIGGTRFNPELMGGAVIISNGTLIFNSPSSGGDTVSIYGATALETVTAKSATFSGDVTTSTGIHALPLGKKTALGADAYGLSVSADGGLQLWGTHFMQGSIWGEQGLKMVQNEVSLTSTDSAAIGFDYANTVDFRTMPNNGDGHGVYRFQCWHWTDDSHTTKELGYVDVQKNSAKSVSPVSLLNFTELSNYFIRKDVDSQTVSSHVTFGKGLTANSITLERDDLSYVPTNNDVLTLSECSARYLEKSGLDQSVTSYVYFAKGAATESLTVYGDVSVSGKLGAKRVETNGLQTGFFQSSSIYDDGTNVLVSKGIGCGYLLGSGFALGEPTENRVTHTIGQQFSPAGLVLSDDSVTGFHAYLYRAGSERIDSTDVLNKREIEALIAEKVTAILTEKGLI